jgi:type I restriction enzyme S subunit
MQLAKQQPATKQTEVGVIPADWVVRPFLSAVRIANGQVDPKEEPYRSMILVAPDHIEGCTGRLLAKETASDQNAISGKYLFKKGDIVYSKIRPYLRKAILADFDGLCSADMYPLKPAPDVAGGLVLALVLGNHFSKYAESVSVRSGMPKINRVELAEYSFALPPTLAEQEAIASALSDADELIESLEKLTAKKRQIKHGTMQELLTGKRRLPGFNGKWETKHVREVIFKHFCGPSPTCEERNIENAVEWGVLKTTAITWENGWDWKKHKVLPRVFWNNPDIELRVGDVVVTKAGPRHRVGVSAWVDEVPKQIVVSGKMIGLRPDPSKANAMMLAAAIASKAAQRYLDQRTTGMAESQVNFENTVLLETPIQIPKIEEQSAIATILSVMDAEIAVLEAKLMKARQVKQGMMQELLTGRTRLI